LLDQEREKLRAIKTFLSLVKYLRDELDWPIETDDFDEIVFDYEAEELGIDPETAVKIDEIKQLRPLVSNQPWGIFFIKFEPKRLPVVVLRRILSRLVFKKRASANKSEHASWNLDDLLFISNYGEHEQRQITFAHFSQDKAMGDLPTLKVLGWDDADTALHLDYCHQELKGKLRWPDDEYNLKDWCEKWSSAFILRHREVITTSKDLASRLADLAKRIRSRANRVLAIETERGQLRKLYKAFQEALIHDLGEDDFADMYAQTIAYGLLAARVSRPIGVTADNITDMIPITNPFLKEMLSTFLTAGGRKGAIDFDELGVQEVVELLNSPDTHMDAILRDFGNRTQQEDPVIHFYELFLSEYDKKKKVQRGVFYTPQPVVSYIVRSVHELLQGEFGLENGLADTTTWGEMVKRIPDIKIPEGVSSDEPFVQILDPATGTATFLVEVIDLIYKTMRAKWMKQGHMALEIQSLWNEYVPKHLLPRLYGFEIMMAPYAIAHMKLGLKLFETGYTFNTDERVHVYLTNSLEPAVDSIPQRVFEQWAPALAHEAKAVNDIKWNKRFTVIIANPPYSKISANMGKWAINLAKADVVDGVIVQSYYKVDGTPLNEKKLWLQDDYVKFIRLAQIQLGKTGVGMLGYVSNHGFLGAPTFNGMRQSLMSSFSTIHIVNLHGDSNVGEQPPAGMSDVNVFDIQQGVAISLMCRSGTSLTGKIHYSDVWGTREEKNSMLSNPMISDFKTQLLTPQSSLYLFVPSDVGLQNEFELWMLLPKIMPLSTSGIVTARDAFVIGFNDKEILERIGDFRNLSISDMDIRKRYFTGKGSSKYPDGDTRGWKLPSARKHVQRDQEWQSRIRECYYRPFDIRKIYYTTWMIDWPRPEFMANMNIEGNVGLLATRQTTTDFCHVTCSRKMIEMKACSHDRNTEFFPLFIKESGKLFTASENTIIRANISDSFMRWVKSWSAKRSGNVEEKQVAKNALYYIMAIVYSQTYRTRYADLLRRSYPRIPTTEKLDLARSISQLGSDLVALHLMESPRLNTPITKWLGAIPSNEIEKVTYSDETVWIDKGQTEGFRGVPENVWNFHIGGYQVCEKWLKDRKGRVLSAEDITHYQKIVVALNEAIRLMKEIDVVIEQYGGWPGAFISNEE
jgi:predicted helicase